MRRVLQEIGHDGLVLKGGNALVLAYGLDRTSGDLDFDSSRRIRNLEAKIRRAEAPDAKITAIDVLKDTETVLRYRVAFESPYGSSTLKIEISYRSLVDEESVELYDGIRVTPLASILNQKLLAAYDGDRPRTKARDLYDLDFIAREHQNVFTTELAARLAAFSADPSALEERYSQTFDDESLPLGSLEELILRLNHNAKTIAAGFEVNGFRIAQEPPQPA